MRRVCDGQDEYLVTPEGSPCTCGLAFDDVGRSTVWPHEAIPTQAAKRAAIEELAATHRVCGEPGCLLGGWADEYLAATGEVWI